MRRWSHCTTYSLSSVEKRVQLLFGGIFLQRKKYDFGLETLRPSRTAAARTWMPKYHGPLVDHEIEVMSIWKNMKNLIHTPPALCS